MKLTSKQKLTIGIFYALALVVLFFINIPKMKFGKGLVAFLGFTAFYALCVFLVKKLYIDKKKTNSL